MKSMTGYGRSELIISGKRYFCEVRSLNHRFLDISLKVPRCLNNFESWIRDIASKYVKRGKIDISITLNGLGDNYDRKNLEIDRDALSHYFYLLSEVKKELGIEEKVSLKDVLEFKDIFIFAEKEVNLETEKEVLQKVLVETLTQLDMMRSNEGTLLKQDFRKRMKKIKGNLEKIENFSKKSVEQYRIKLKERIEELLVDITVDNYRIEHEVVIYADRTNITEEAVRLKSHLKQLGQFLENSGTVGRKIDFMLQECSREANTIASKSGSSEISHLVVELKTLIEEMREQANNIE